MIRFIHSMMWTLNASINPMPMTSDGKVIDMKKLYEEGTDRTKGRNTYKPVELQRYSFNRVLSTPSQLSGDLGSMTMDY